MTSQEIIDFMLGRKKGETASESVLNNSLAVVVESRLSPLRRSPGSAKKVQSVSSSFAKTMVNEWLETDDTLHQVVQSIAGLRERLWHTSRALAVLRDSEEPAAWKQCGYRGGGGDGDDGVLTGDDLQLTLDYDLRQHERMMQVLRRSLSTLHQAQEALGRRLDEYYRLVDCDFSNQNRFILSLEECQSIFVASASELYRKQALADEVLNSVLDLLFDPDREKTGMPVEAETPNPRRVSRQCSERWPRHYEQSFLVNYIAVLEKLQHLDIALVKRL